MDLEGRRGGNRTPKDLIISISSTTILELNYE